MKLVKLGEGAVRKDEVRSCLKVNFNFTSHDFVYFNFPAHLRMTLRTTATMPGSFFSVYPLMFICSAVYAARWRCLWTNQMAAKWGKWTIRDSRPLHGKSYLPVPSIILYFSRSCGKPKKFIPSSYLTHGWQLWKTCPIHLPIFHVGSTS